MDPLNKYATQVGGKLVNSTWMDSTYKKVGEIGGDSVMKPRAGGMTPGDMAGMGLAAAEGVASLIDKGRAAELPQSAASRGLQTAAKWGSMGLATGNPFIAAGATIAGGAVGAVTAIQELKDYNMNKERTRALKSQNDAVYGKGLTDAMRAKAFEMYG